MTKEQLLNRYKNNKSFCEKISFALQEIAEEKINNNNQSDITPEESIYVKFVDNKENPKMEKWQWEEKLKLLDNFKTNAE